MEKTGLVPDKILSMQLETYKANSLAGGTYVSLPFEKKILNKKC